MTPGQFLKPAHGEPAINPARFVQMRPAEFAAAYSFKPDRERTRTALEELVAANVQLRRQGADKIDDRDAALTLAFLQHHNVEAWPA